MKNAITLSTRKFMESRPGFRAHGYDSTKIRQYF